MLGNGERENQIGLPTRPDGLFSGRKVSDKCTTR